MLDMMDHVDRLEEKGEDVTQARQSLRMAEIYMSKNRSERAARHLKKAKRILNEMDGSSSELKPEGGEVELKPPKPPLPPPPVIETSELREPIRIPLPPDLEKKLDDMAEEEPLKEEPAEPKPKKMKKVRKVRKVKRKKAKGTKGGDE
jgi:hypothetical protein